LAFRLRALRLEFRPGTNRSLALEQAVQQVSRRLGRPRVAVAGARLFASKVLLSLVLVCAAICSRPAPVAAQHVDVLVQILEGQVVTGAYDFGTATAQFPRRVFDRAFEFREGNRMSGNDPGFNSVASPPGSLQPLPPNTELRFRLVSHPALGGNFGYWDGEGPVRFVPLRGEASFEIAFAGVFGVLNQAWADGSATDVEGFAIATTDPTGGLHQHLRLSVVGSSVDRMPPVGIYAVALSLSVPGFAVSEPVFLLLHAESPDAAAQAAVVHLKDVVDQLPTEPESGLGSDGTTDEMIDESAPGGCSVAAMGAKQNGSQRGNPARLVLLVGALLLAPRLRRREQP